MFDMCANLAETGNAKVWRMQARISQYMSLNILLHHVADCCTIMHVCVVPVLVMPALVDVGFATPGTLRNAKVMPSYDSLCLLHFLFCNKFDSMDSCLTLVMHWLVD